MSDHSTAVTEDDDQYFDATCSCGWNDPGFEDRDDADYAAEQHRENPEQS